MNLIRPELRTRLWLWREVIWAGAVALMGLWALVAGGFLLQILGALVIALGLGLGFLALRRLRFGAGGANGPGVVQIDEGRIRYFGPFYGGAVSVPALNRIEIAHTADGKRMWHLHHDDGNSLVIPAAARDAEGLFDTFAALPGLDSGKLVRAVEAASRAEAAQNLTIWRRDGAQVLTPLPSRRTPSASRR